MGFNELLILAKDNSNSIVGLIVIFSYVVYRFSPDLLRKLGLLNGQSNLVLINELKVEIKKLQSELIEVGNHRMTDIKENIERNYTEFKKHQDTIWLKVDKNKDEVDEKILNIYRELGEIKGLIKK